MMNTVGLLLAGVLASASVSAGAGATLNPALPTLFIAGDSTAAPGPTPDQEGWGEPFAAYFDAAKINIANRARGGRSSRTFITEGHWEQLLGELKPGDFVLLQFGHNDAGALNEEPPGSTRPLRARGTIPGVGEETQEIDNVITGQHEVVHSFGWYLRKMIVDVRNKRATPIVLSLTVRNDWKEGRVECGADSYRQWDFQIAKSNHVGFIDLTRIVADKYQAMGSEAVTGFFSKDHVHTTPAGADYNAAAVVSGLRTMNAKPSMRFLSPKGRAVRADRGRSSRSVCGRVR